MRHGPRGLRRDLRASALLILAIVTTFPRTASADGGIVAASVTRDGRRLTVFLSPAAPRVGVIDVSALIDPARSGNAGAGSGDAAAPEITVTARGVERDSVMGPDGGPGRGAVISATAHRAERGNRLLQEALIEIPEPGEWRIEVVQGDLVAPFTIVVAPALAPWQSELPWLLAWLPMTGLLLWRDLLLRSRR